MPQFHRTTEKGPLFVPVTLVRICDSLVLRSCPFSRLRFAVFTLRKQLGV